MMRAVLGLCWGAAICWLLAMPVAAQQGNVSSTKSDDPWPEEVKGYGMTFELAKKDAAKRLREEVIGYLNGRGPTLRRWQPTVEFVTSQLLKGRGRAGPDETLGELGNAKTWIYSVRPLDMTSIAALEENALRREQAEQRIILFSDPFGKGLALLGFIFALLFARDWWKRSKASATTGMAGPR